MTQGEFKRRLIALGITEGVNSSGTARIWQGVALSVTDNTYKTDNDLLELSHENENRDLSKENSVNIVSREAKSDKTQNELGSSSTILQNITPDETHCTVFCNQCSDYQKIDGHYACIKKMVDEGGKKNG